MDNGHSILYEILYSRPDAPKSLLEESEFQYLTTDLLRRPPKSMALMDDASCSKVFRQGYPRFNGLIGSYHWLQVGLYEPLVGAATPEERAAVIFDNLPMMHDIISDILVSDRVPRAEKGRVIEAALREFRDPSRDTMTMEEWHDMAAMMGGVERMGGVAWRPPPR